MRLTLFALLATACGDSGNVTNASCSTAACGGDVTGSWAASSYCGDPAATGRCTGGTASGALNFMSDKSYHAELQLNCPNGTSDILHDGAGTWRASGTQLTLTPSGGAAFSLPYCASGSSMVLGKSGDSLYAVWTRPTR